MPDPLRPPFPRLEVRNPRPKLQSLLSQELVKLQYVHKVYANKSPLNIFEKRDGECIQGLPKFLSTPIILGTGKATNFKFCTHIHRIDQNKSKSPLKILT